MRASDDGNISSIEIQTASHQWGRHRRGTSRMTSSASERLLQLDDAHHRRILLAVDNRSEQSPTIQQDFTVHFVENMDEVLKVALLSEPVPLIEEFPPELEGNSNIQESMTH